MWKKRSSLTTLSQSTSRRKVSTWGKLQHEGLTLNSPTRIPKNNTYEGMVSLLYSPGSKAWFSLIMRLLALSESNAVRTKINRCMYYMRDAYLYYIGRCLIINVWRILTLCVAFRCRMIEEEQNMLGGYFYDGTHHLAWNVSVSFTWNHHTPHSVCWRDGTCHAVIQRKKSNDEMCLITHNPWVHRTLSVSYQLFLLTLITWHKATILPWRIDLCRGLISPPMR